MGGTILHRRWLYFKLGVHKRWDYNIGDGLITCSVFSMLGWLHVNHARSEYKHLAPNP